MISIVNFPRIGGFSRASRILLANVSVNSAMNTAPRFPATKENGIATGILSKPARAGEGKGRMNKIEKKVARIFQEPTGKFLICDDALDYLDARGHGYDSRSAAIASLRGWKDQPYPGMYTHYLTPSGKARKL